MNDIHTVRITFRTQHMTDGIRARLKECGELNDVTSRSWVWSATYEGSSLAAIKDAYKDFVPAVRLAAPFTVDATHAIRQNQGAVR